MSSPWLQTDEEHLYAYTQLREITRDQLVEIITEWEMHERFGKAADDLWIDQWPKQKARVTALYQDPRLQHATIDSRIIGVVWTQAFKLAVRDKGDIGTVWLCPYGCISHRVPYQPTESKKGE